ncbi:MAG: hypothetical protein VX738_04955 [Planctomycetota bacterium]|nr:hypothetical protein [Planctomycetota bacterium]
MSILLPVLFALGYLFLWSWQFVQLMLLEDKQFPGKSDKTMWVVVFIVFWFIAPVPFMWWKKSIIHLRELENNPEP